MPYADAGGTRIYYESHGEGPAVLFVHGSGGHHVSWFQQVAYFRQWYRVLTIDLRGFGNSDAVPGGPDSLDFVHDIAAVLDHAGVERCAILGQSIGSAPALRLALAMPQRVSAVIMAHSTGGMDDAEIAQGVKADRHAAEQLPILDRLMTPAFRAAQPAMTFLFQQQGSFNKATIRDIRNMAAPGPTPQQVAASGVPVFFLAGERDAVLTPATVRLAHGKLPGSTLAIVTNGPHSLYWEMAPVFNNVVHGFLRTIYPDAAA